MIIAIIDTLTAVLAGTLVFSILGYLAYELKKPIVDVINGGGVELAFISYPTAVATFKSIPQFFSIIFFLMLMTLGLGTVIGYYSSIVGIFCDQFGNSNRRIITLLVLLLSFLSSLVYVTPGGQQILDLVDFINSEFIIPSIVILEIFVVSYIYGIDDFIHDVNFMLYKNFGMISKVTLGTVIPWTLVIFFIYHLANFPDLDYNGLPYPDSAKIAMWMLVAFALIAIPIVAIYYITSSKRASFFEKIVDCCTPTEDWGPQDVNERRQWARPKEG